MQDLARVDVADSGHPFLVEQELLHREPALPGERLEPRTIRRMLERIGAEDPERRITRESRVRNRAQQSEASWILKPELGSVGEFDPQMHVRKVPTRSIAMEEPASAHAEMREQRPFAVEAKQQILAVPVDAFERVATEPSRQRPGHLPAQRGARMRARRTVLGTTSRASMRRTVSTSGAQHLGAQTTQTGVRSPRGVRPGRKSAPERAPVYTRAASSPAADRSGFVMTRTISIAAFAARVPSPRRPPRLLAARLPHRACRAAVVV
jgi:hypothetical protein